MVEQAGAGWATPNQTAGGLGTRNYQQTRFCLPALQHHLTAYILSCGRDIPAITTISSATIISRSPGISINSP